MSSVSQCLTHTAVETNSIDKPAVIEHCRDKGPTVLGQMSPICAVGSWLQILFKAETYITHQSFP